MDIKTKLSQLIKNFSSIEKSIDVEEKQKKAEELENLSLQSNFWSDDQKARVIMQELSGIRSEISELSQIKKELSDIEEIIQMSKSESEFELQDEVEISLRSLEKRIEKLKISTYMFGTYDKSNAILTIHSGQGGVDAMDWAEMLSRMYVRYVDKNSQFSYKKIEETRGEEAGIKSTSFHISGLYAYGSLKKEAGTHRLVRLSPFNADNLRQTSFALIEVLPDIQDDSKEVQVRDDEVEWQFFRSGGKGGQNVNKVSTAVRLKHIPSGIVVESQAERKQEQNRKIAMTLLKGKLWAIKEQERESKIDNLKGQKMASWGTQIRSYVLHPYKMVKDLRTSVETSNAAAVLDGDIQDFINAEIAL